MNIEDLEYLREMVVKSETEDFSDEQLQRISGALRTNVNADDTTEALDLTAQIIYEQSQYTDRLGNDRKVNRENLHNLTKEVIYYGELLGATDALKTVDDFDFAMDVSKENITEKNANRDNSFGNSFLESSLYASKSPEAIKSIIDKGGKFNDEVEPNHIVNILLDRVTSDYNGQLEEFGENSIKNNLENLAVLIETNMIEKPKYLDKLISNPELFEKYPDVMNKLFKDDKDLPNKLDNVRNREKSKAKNKEETDYLQDKADVIEAAVHRIKMRQKRGKTRVSYSYRNGETGNSVTGEMDATHQKIASQRTKAYLEKMSERNDTIGEKTREYLQKSSIDR